MGVVQDEGTNIGMVMHEPVVAASNLLLLN